MASSVTIGVKSNGLGPVCVALSNMTGWKFERRRSAAAGEYEHCRKSDVLVKHNFSATREKWAFPEHREFEVLVVARETKNPKFFRGLAKSMPYEAKVIEEREC